MSQPQPPPRPLEPHRLLALDPGERRVGVAVSDELGLFAHPRAAIVGRAEADVLAAVVKLVGEHAIEEIVVGLPLSLSGRDSAQTASARAFASRVRRATGLPVLEWDERFSTTEAARQVKGADRRRAGELDSAAAAIVLQAALDARRLRS